MAGTKIITVEGRGISIVGNDIDTDQIIPARYMKIVTFAGIGEFAFYDQRYNSEGKELAHPFNDAAYKGAKILVTNENFGCGSSREHAPQALYHYGIRAIVAVSFAEIFAGNCVMLGLPVLTLEAPQIVALQTHLREDPSLHLSIDIASMQIRSTAFSASCRMPEAFRNSFLTGMWDSTGLLLSNKDQIQRTAASLPYIQNFSEGAGA